MPWWSWILLWVALVAIALLIFVVLGIRLFRGFMALLKEFEESSAKLGNFLDSRSVEGSSDDASAERPGLGIFADPDTVRAEYRAGKAERQELRRVKRVARKVARHQPRTLHDIGMR
ncbi:hypothetical protein ACQR35_10185 [Pseudarthrobacter sp. J1738]|uniref:hypothetical protein n=1 Tax=unclassified Pseudarthrobacter TaxID=2647000 RepID=UPI003D297657